MRVRHLNDFEIQGLLDRRAAAPNSDVPGERYLKDLDAQEHLDNCPTCLDEVALYRRLFGELHESDNCRLPRNFASRVTFSLPPFKARRTRARLQMAGLWGGVLMTFVVWFLTRLDWSSLVTRVTLYGVLKYASLKTWVMAWTDGLSWPTFDLARFWQPAVDFKESFERALATDGSAVSFVVLAGCVLMLIASLDHLYRVGTWRQRESH